MNPLFALMAGGGLLSSYGALEEGYAKAGAAKYNAAIAEQNAVLARAQGVENERQIRVIGRKAIGQIRAQYGASGITSEGSPMDVIQESVANAEMDALTARYNSELKARGYEIDAQGERYKADAAEKGANISALASLLGMGGSIAAKA